MGNKDAVLYALSQEDEPVSGEVLAAQLGVSLKQAGTPAYKGERSDRHCRRVRRPFVDTSRKGGAPLKMTTGSEIMSGSGF